MLFFYHPLRMLAGSIIWMALSGSCLWWMIQHGEHVHRSPPIIAMLFVAGVLILAAWNAWVSLRWAWTMVRYYYGRQ